MTRLVVLVSFVASCGGPTVLAEKPGPRGLRADQHVTMAEREDRRADELTKWPELHRGSDGQVPAMALVEMPWRGHWDTSDEHRRAARAHRDAAAALEAEYEDACKDVPPELAATSPLRRFGVGGNEVEGGAVVVLSKDAGPPARLLAHLRCHRAWMMLGRSDMDDCPLDVAGLQVDAVGDDHGITLTMTVADTRLVPELRRRAAHDLELGHSH